MIAWIAARTGLSLLAVRALAVVVSLATLSSAVVIYNSYQRNIGAQKLQHRLQQDDNQTLREKAKRDAEIREESNDILVDRLTGGVQPDP